MVIALEGLSCAGKTAVSEELSTRHSASITFIPEFVLNKQEDITTELCMSNDLAKSRISKSLFDTGKNAIMDRSHLSTLVYTYAESDKKFNITQKWYKNAFEQGQILEPDLYVYLRIQAAKSLERASSVGRLNSKYAWYNNTAAAFNKYEEYFSNNNLSSPCHIIDVDNLEFYELINRLEKIMTQYMDIT
jgi:thymidylate kinase